MTARFLTLAVLLIATVACSKRDAVERDDFAAWSVDAGRARPIAEYARFLQERGVGDVLPMRELLRSGRRWQRCGRDRYAIPPREQWRAMVPTLALAADLRARGLLPAARVASVYRDASFNRCEGGSPLSRHLANAALDFDLTAQEGGIARLCDYWRRYGRERRFGLGFYSDHQIHVDTTGYRTWGGDYTRKTSLCAATTT